MDMTSARKMPWITPRERDAPAEVRPWWDSVRVLGLLLLITLAAFALDDRKLLDVSVWSKPLKFQVSLILHFVTLALAYRLLDPPARASRWLRFAIPAAAFAALFEIFWIMVQAARGRASHFNNASEFESAMYGLMGLGSLLLVLAPLVLGVLILRNRNRRGDELRLAAGIGLVISALATLVVAGYLSGSGGHWVGVVASDADGLPLLGWSTVAGDLRVAHFFATHAMQVLPLAVLAWPRAPRRRGLVPGLAAAWLALIVFTFVQALLGHPFLA